MEPRLEGHRSGTRELKRPNARQMRPPTIGAAQLWTSGASSCRSGEGGQGERSSNDWAPVHESIAGPVIFAMRRMSGTHQFYIETSRARGLCVPGLADMSYCRRRRRWLAAAVHLNPRRDLASSKVIATYPVASCSSPNVILRTVGLCGPHVRACCASSRPHDRTAILRRRSRLPAP